MISREYGTNEEIHREEDQNPIYKKILINRRFKYDVREVLAADSEELSVAESLGRISAEIKYKCPPGFPVLVYGEEILAEHLQLFGPTEKIKVMKNSYSPTPSPAEHCHNNLALDNRFGL
jgi:arginine/lysine/ornithine decarboxylase